MNKLITILGPTASGKTKLAAQLASVIDGEIISADSRQVYRGMDIGTGKDLDEYVIDNKQIPCHLIDNCDAGDEYNVFQFQQDFLHAYQEIIAKGKTPILCGGTGFYLSAALSKEQLIAVPENKTFRKKSESKPTELLFEELAKLKTLHNSTDSDNRERVLRALEIELYKIAHPIAPKMPVIDHHVFGLSIERAKAKEKITVRLKERLENGMIEEVEKLLKDGVDPYQLKLYGLEYRFVTEYIQGSLNYNDLFQKLNTAIHVFAKKQMTWFRKMERQNQLINWIDVNLSTQEKIELILKEQRSQTI